MTHTASQNMQLAIILLLRIPYLSLSSSVSAPNIVRESALWEYRDDTLLELARIPPFGVAYVENCHMTQSDLSSKPTLIYFPLDFGL